MWLTLRAFMLSVDCFKNTWLFIIISYLNLNKLEEINICSEYIYDNYSAYYSLDRTPFTFIEYLAKEIRKRNIYIFST